MELLHFRTRRLITLYDTSENGELAGHFASTTLVYLSMRLTPYRLTQRELSEKLMAPSLVVWQCMPWSKYLPGR